MLYGYFHFPEMRAMYSYNGSLPKPAVDQRVVSFYTLLTNAASGVEIQGMAATRDIEPNM